MLSPLTGTLGPLGRARGGAYTPASVANLAEWLQPLTLGSLSSAVASWPDSSGVGAAAVQATGSAQPLVAALPSGSKTTQYDGVDDVLVAPVDGTLLTALTLMLVVRRTTSGGALFQWANALAAGQPFMLLTNDAGGTTRSYLDNNYRFTLTSVIGTTYLYTWTQSGGTWKVYINNSLFGTYVGGTTWQNHAASWYFGNGFQGYGAGQIAEAAYWPRVLTATELSDLQTNYFSPTYGI